MAKDSPANAGELRDRGLIPVKPGQENALEEGMGTHSSILDWRTLWIGEPGGLYSAGSQRVRHD